MLHDGVEELVPAEDPPRCVGHHDAIAIAIERNAVIGLRRQHHVGHGLWMGGPHLMIDVEAIGLVTHANDFSAELVKDIGRHVVGRTVGGVHHQAQAR